MSDAGSLAGFLLARIAEDQDDAQQSLERDPTPWTAYDGLVGVAQHECGASCPGGGQHGYGGLWDNEGASSLSMSIATATHVARHDPARVLLECEAKRRIVELHTPAHECTEPGDGFAGVFGSMDGSRLAECSTLRLLASVYADHPDYPECREEWKL